MKQVFQEGVIEMTYVSYEVANQEYAKGMIVRPKGCPWNYHKEIGNKPNPKYEEWEVICPNTLHWLNQ